MKVTLTYRDSVDSEEVFEGIDEIQPYADGRFIGGSTTALAGPPVEGMPNKVLLVNMQAVASVLLEREGAEG